MNARRHIAIALALAVATVVGTGYFYLSFCFQLAISHYHINLVLFHQELNTTAHFIRNTATAFDHGVKILLHS